MRVAMLVPVCVYVCLFVHNLPIHFGQISSTVITMKTARYRAFLYWNVGMFDYYYYSIVGHETFCIPNLSIKLIWVLPGIEEQTHKFEITVV